jgi:cytochrome c oxidase assembly factor CtaG
LSTPGRSASLYLARSSAASRIGQVLTHPAVCWLAGTGIVIAWHVPKAHGLAMSSETWHLAQQVTFFAAGLLFWRPVFAPPGDVALLFSAPLYLFLATLPCDALSAFLAFSDRVLYPSHASAPVLFGLTPLRDQEFAGALMWFWVTIAFLLPAAAITLRMLSPARRANPA